ncbi:MAG: TonB-dependent receptor [Bacteroidetes bacterium]|nr:TonB-dependent receptor [Bacteroidota bacterium]
MKKYFFNKGDLFSIFFFLLSITILFNQDIPAQEKGSLRGIVVDSTNGEVLPFCNAIIENTRMGATTNSNGYFLIPSIPAKKNYNVIVSFVGYATKKIKVFIVPDKITDIEIKLIPTSILLKPVERVGERTIEKNATDIGLQRISIKELEMLPKGVESDVFRSLQYIPGVQSTGDVSARYYVRGSPSNENLVLINGATIYNPFHALGIFSVIDPDMINSIEFYKGGFPAQYNGRLSSVLNIITKDGNKNNFGAKASASFLSGKALVEGPIPYGSFIVTGRKSFSTEILKKFLDEKDVPINFYDLSYKLNYENPNFIKGSKFVIQGFSSGDKIESTNPLIENINWYNNIFGVDWSQITDSPLFFNMALNWSNFNGAVTPNLSSAKPKTNQVNDLSLKTSFTYIYDSKDEMEVGLNVQDLDTKLLLENSLGATSDIGSHGTNINIYALYKLMRFDDFGANIGTALDLTGLSQAPGSTFQFGPRLSLTYRVIPQIALKAAWGIYTQQVTTLSDENEIISLFEPWIITPSYLKPSSAIHYTIGMKTDFTENLSLDIQGYYKVMQNIPTLNDNKITDSDPDLVAASGESYGWEFLLNFIGNPFSFTGSYSLSWTYKDVAGWLYYPRYDVRNALNLILSANLGKGWEASAIWVLNSGLPFTQNMGYYNKFYFNDLYADWSILEDYKPYAILADKNLGRLPDYHRLDLSLSKKFTISDFKFSFDISIINVYNRKNLFYFKRDTGEIVNMLPFLPTATLKIEI